MVEAALMQYSVKRLKCADTGAKYVALPDNLVAIWWVKRHDAGTIAMHGGNAA